jgi:Zn-dependent protease with chaperone function
MAACVGLVVAAAVVTLFAVLIMKTAEGDDSGIVGIVAVLMGVGVFIYGMILLAGYALCLAMLLGLVAFGVKAASSSIAQSREHLADACAAQWTRNPLALASALAKIQSGTRMSNPKGHFIAPLWLDYPDAEKATGIRQRLLSFLLHTHPTIERRIALLREMAGTSAITDARWLLAIRPSAWQQIKEWLLPLLATILALFIAAALVHDLIH